MTKRIAILAALVAVAVTLAGCGFKPPVQWNEAEERERVAEALGKWVTGIEGYDVDAMAGDAVLAAGFKLIIQEGSARPYEKNAAKLMEELLADRDNQLRFRKALDEGGAGYELEFDVDSECGRPSRAAWEVWTSPADGSRMAGGTATTG